MKKNSYIQPSVKAVEIMMVQTLCVSGGGSGSSMPIPSGGETDEQL